MPARLVEHELAEGSDETGLFGDGDEFGRGHEAALGVLPSHESLDAEHRGAAQAHDRLKVHAQLITLEGPAQVGLDLEALEGDRTHAPLERLDPVASPLLGPVHGRVGIAQERVRGCV